MPTPSPRQIDWLILLCVDITVPVMLGWEKHSGTASTTIAIGSAIVVLGALNAVLFSTFRRRDPKQSLPAPRNFAFGAVGLALASACTAIVVVAITPAPKSDIQVALSNTPLEDIQPVRKRVFVELLRHLVANKREEDAEFEDAKKNPISPPLYSAGSFANIDVIHGTENKIKMYAQVDFDYSNKNQQAWGDFRQKMESVDLDYLKELSESQTERVAIETKALDMEKRWLSSAVALYDFAAENSKEIKVQNGQLAFSKPTVQDEFEKQRNLSKAYLDKMTALETELAQRQREAQERSGIAVP